MGYKEGDEEDDKYFCPETGAHFEYSEVVRKLRRIRNKMKKFYPPVVKSQLSVKKELTKTMVNSDLRHPDNKFNVICKLNYHHIIDATQNSNGTVMSSINHSKDFDLKTMASIDNGFRIHNTMKDNSYQDQIKINRKNNISQLNKLGNNFATEDLRK
jgi:hypothetical protein